MSDQEFRYPISTGIIYYPLLNIIKLIKELKNYFKSSPKGQPATFSTIIQWTSSISTCQT